eukprot:CAMPEP_0181214054 /NCGR_PEP_ID=MMETSP1096-20121128/25243_1 /TAXON_ID=156174 ORGANISM="Chrysochromulina ericina, Strain CCMP281" /NCGR_SAMPLE_ID=MMETSP1096 /ASSEMBLY_ACC=CAM_ASM_000453 /LENGTH=175 /DNA_ID=CAMNT_0023305753 /DNA_START=216 /DNA_END=744 /DNA_ORIENTATION=-
MEHGAQRRTAPILRQRHPYIFETSHSVSGTESIQHQSIAADQLYTTCMSYMYELVSGVCALMWSEHDTPPAVSTPKRGVSNFVLPSVPTIETRRQLMRRQALSTGFISRMHQQLMRRQALSTGFISRMHQLWRTCIRLGGSPPEETASPDPESGTTRRDLGTASLPATFLRNCTF